MREANGKRRHDLKAPAQSARFGKQGKTVFFHLGEGGVIANGKVGVAAEAAQGDAHLLPIFENDVANLGNQVVVVIFGLAGDIGIVVDHDDADARRLLVVELRHLFVIGDVLEDIKPRIA